MMGCVIIYLPLLPAVGRNTKSHGNAGALLRLNLPLIDSELEHTSFVGPSYIFNMT